MMAGIRPVEKPWGRVLRASDFLEQHQALFRKCKARVKARQIGGDDGYHYCLVIDHRVKMGGMTRSSAQHEMDRAIVNLMNDRDWNA